MDPAPKGCLSICAKLPAQLIVFLQLSCRGWYDVGKNLAIYNGTSLHITAPYQFSRVMVGQSATSPLVDPRTGEYVGQTLYDFRADDIYDALLEHAPLSSGKFPVLIAMQSDGDNDTVIGPGFSLSESAKPIAQVVLPMDSNCTEGGCSKRVAIFDKIVGSMKVGNSSMETFSRKESDGSIEIIHMAYTPVNVKSFRPANSSDYSRGVLVSDYLIYSLGLAVTQSKILEPFDQIEDGTERTIRVAKAVLSAFIVAASLVVIYISHRVTMSIIEPMVYLRDLIQSINR
jgi:hypothetical protein